jgi:hypothetical protein
MTESTQRDWRGIPRGWLAGPAGGHRSCLRTCRWRANPPTQGPYSPARSIWRLPLKTTRFQWPGNSRFSELIEPSDARRAATAIQTLCESNHRRRCKAGRHETRLRIAGWGESTNADCDSRVARNPDARLSCSAPRNAIPDRPTETNAHVARHSRTIQADIVEIPKIGRPLTTGQNLPTNDSIGRVSRTSQSGMLSVGL